MDAQIKIRRVACGLFLFFLILLCRGTEASPFRFEYFDVSRGLAANSVRALMQDDRGFMWFGTDNGLNRFDGYSFKLYHHIEGDTTSLGCNYIYALHEDKYGIIWVGTEVGVYWFRPDLEKFCFLDVRTAEGNQINSFVTSIAQDQWGKIWISTLAQGVFSYDPGLKQLEQYHIDASDPAYKLLSNNICFLYIEMDGTVWAAPQQMGMPLNCYNSEKKMFEPFTPKASPEIVNNLAVYAMAEDKNGFVWFGTWTTGLCRLDKRTGELTSFLVPDKKDGAYHIHSLLMFEPGILLVGSDDGLHRFNTETFEYMHMSSSEFNDKGLSDKFIYPMVKDREGGLWIGTYYGGVNYSPPAKGDIEGYTHSDYRNSVNGNVISSFCEDAKGNLWIGSDDGGLSYMDVATNTFRNYESGTGANTLSYHNVHALCLDGDYLWVGTYSGGLNRLHIPTGRFNYYMTEPNNNKSLDNSSVYSVYKDSDATIWIGSMQGIMTYERQSDNFVRMKHTGTTTMDILEDNRQRIWFATGGRGLYSYDKLSGEWRHFQFYPGNKGSLPSNQVSGLALDKNKRLWVGTDKGLCYRDEGNDRFVFVPMNVPAPSINAIVVYEDYLWLTTPNGLIVYKPENNAYRVLSQNDGLISDQFTTKAALLSSAGKLYLGTIHGFNVLDPETLSENENVPPVVLTNLQIFNKDEIIRPGGILNHSLDHTNSIELTYKQNVFSIEYAALSYSSPGKNQYRYKLQGFDKDWNEVGNQRKATYTNLPAGHYTFRVIASNNDGVWNSEGAELQVIIHPPFWKTTLAYIGYVLIVLGMVGYIIYMQRKRTERKHKAKMRELHVEKEKELHDAKINFFTLIAHEIRTPVSLIIGPLEKIMENTEELPAPVQSDLKIIDRNSQRLLSLVNQLLDFRKAEQGAFIIHFSNQNIQELLNNVYIRFKPLIEQKGISFYLNMPEQPIMATVDAEAITKVVSNLLTNAFKYGKKEIILSCTADEKEVCIRVKDDGRGIQSKELNEIFRPFYQIAKNNVPGTGIGLSLVKLLVDAHHGTIDVDSQPQVSTTFTVHLPIHQKVEVTTTLEEVVNEEVADNVDIPRVTPDTRLSGELQPTMLIVEDNAEMRNFLCEHFEWSYTILLAENGKEGLAQLHKHSVDIIISDVMMPVMDGITFSKKVKDDLQYSHIPLILLTAKTDTDSKVSGIQSGADAYVEKPFSPQMLRVQVENLLASRKKLRKKFSEMPFVPLDSMAGNKADEQFLAKMNKIIEKNISNMDFSIDKLAEQLCISRSGLFAKIKNLAGMTPNELIQLIRLKKAAELLATKEFRINEICYQVGFNNPSYFSKCFQKQFGVLPKDFLSQQDHKN